MPVGTVDYIAIVPRDEGYQCNIHVGPGHHGIGTTPHQALLNAATAWYRYEEIINAPAKTKSPEGKPR